MMHGQKNIKKTERSIFTFQQK